MPEFSTPARIGLIVGFGLTLAACGNGEPLPVRNNPQAIHPGDAARGVSIPAATLPEGCSETALQGNACLIDTSLIGPEDVAY